MTELSANITDEQRRLAQAVREACLRAAISRCEDARMDGLCWEGAWEAAINAIQKVDLDAVINGTFQQAE